MIETRKNSKAAAAAAQLDVKQSIIARLGIEKLSRDYDDALLDLEVLLIERIDLQAKISAERQQVEEVKALVYLNGAIDGKNEAQRAAQLTLALRDDTTYQAARKAQDNAEYQLESNTQKIETTRRRMDAVKIKLRIAASSLDLLAS